VKYYSAIILLIKILFICFIGDQPKTLEGQENSLDRQFYNKYPQLYNYLDVIGLRSSSIVEIDAHKVLMQTCVSYTTFFLTSIFLTNHFTQKKKVIDEDMNFNEE